MAIQTRLVDDFDGTPDGVRSYSFALDGITYTIDLSENNVARLRAALAPFIAAGRRAAKPSGGKSGSSKHTQTSDATDNATVRSWWNTAWQTHQLPAPTSHGRVPAAVIAAYRRHH